MKIQKRSSAIALLVLMVLGGSMGLLGSSLIATNVTTPVTSFDSPKAASASGNLVRNPSFTGDWAADWVGSVPSQTTTKVQEVHTLARHQNWLGQWTVDEDIDYMTTSRDDGGDSYATNIALIKTGDNHLKYTASLYSSGYAKATADSSTWPRVSEASVSWSLDDTSVYHARISQDLAPLETVMALNYAVLAGNYMMHTTMVEAEDWYAQIIWTLEAPDGSMYEIRDEYFSSEVMDGAARSFNSEVRNILTSEGVGNYKLHIDMNLRIRHMDSRSHSATGQSGCTAQTPNVVYDDTVSLEVYGISLQWGQGLVPPLMNAVQDNPDYDGDVIVSWNAVGEAEKYQIFRSTEPFSFYTQGVYLGETTGTTWNDNGLPTGTYYYAVRSWVSGQDPSPISSCELVNVILPPEAPILDKPTDSLTGAVELSWNVDPIAESYMIYQSTSFISDISGMSFSYTATESEYTIPFLTDGTYHFVVVAHNEAGDSVPSNCENVSVTVTQPPDNTTMWLSRNSDSKITGEVTVNWNYILGATTYYVLRDIAPVDTNSPSLVIGQTTRNKFIDYQVQDEHRYYYAVVAGNALFNSTLVSNCEDIYVDIPNFMDDVAEWVANMDPLLRTIVELGLDALLGSSGSDLVTFLETQQNSWSADFDIDIGSWDNIGGVMGISCNLKLNIALTLTANTVEFIFTPKSSWGFNIEEIALTGAFGDASGVISQLSAYGVNVGTKLDVWGKIHFKYDFTANQLTVEEVALRLNPSVSVSVNVLQLILAVAAPEAEPIVTQIVKIVDKLTGYNLYGLLMSTLTIDVDFVVKWFPTQGVWVTDTILTMQFNLINLNFVQPDGNDVNEIEIGIFGQGGIHYDSVADEVTGCGQLDFFVTFNTANCEGIFESMLEDLAGFLNLKVNTPNVWSVVAEGGACTPINFDSPAPVAATAGVDQDNDRLDEDEEAAIGSSDLLPDTDHDGLWDYIEAQEGSDPTLADTDGDGLDDCAEYYDYQTNLTNVDTDGDGYSDKLEIMYYGTNSLNPDTDGDRLNDKEEFDTYGTDSLVADTDKDGVSDGWEVLWYGTNPRYYSSRPADSDGDGLYNKDETMLGTNPNLNEGADVDGDGLKTFQELLLYKGLDPNDPDTDDDGVLDGVEVAMGLFYLDSDTDDDGLLDGEELYTYMTDPFDTDTDDDGYSDYMEVKFGSDPLDPNSVPDLSNDTVDPSSFWIWFLIGGVVVAGGSISGYFVYRRRKFGGSIRGLRSRGLGRGKRARASLSTLKDRLTRKHSTSYKRALKRTRIEPISKSDMELLREAAKRAKD